MFEKFKKAVDSAREKLDGFRSTLNAPRPEETSRAMEILHRMLTFGSKSIYKTKTHTLVSTRRGGAKNLTRPALRLQYHRGTNYSVGKVGMANSLRRSDLCKPVKRHKSFQQMAEELATKKVLEGVAA